MDRIAGMCADARMVVCVTMYPGPVPVTGGGKELCVIAPVLLANMAPTARIPACARTMVTATQSQESASARLAGRGLYVRTLAPPGCTGRGVASSVIVTMEHLVTMLLGSATVCQDIQETCVKKSVPMGCMARIVKKAVNVRMMESVTWLMEAASVALVGRDHSARRGFVIEKSCMVPTAH